MSWKGLRKILCVRLDAMGDLLMTEPAIRALKESNPGAQMTLLTNPASASAGRLLASVDEVIAYSAPWITQQESETGADLHLIHELKSRSFDAAVIFTSHSSSPLPAALLCHLAEIPRRLAHCRENPHALLTDWMPEVEPEKTIRHEVRRQLELVASVSCHTSDERIRVKIPSATRRKVLDTLRERGIDFDKPFVIIHPGAADSDSAENFGAIVRELSLRLDHQLLLVGDEADRAFLAATQESACVPCYALSGVFNEAELAYVLSKATLVLSSNSCVIHLASAMRAPVVDLRRTPDPAGTPWLVPHRSLFRDISPRLTNTKGAPRLAEPTQVVLAAHELLWDLDQRRRVKNPKVISFGREIRPQTALWNDQRSLSN